MEDVDVILQDYLLQEKDGELVIDDETWGWSRKKLIDQLKEDVSQINTEDTSLVTDFELVIAYLESISDEAFDQNKRIYMTYLKKIPKEEEVTETLTK